MHLAGVVQNNYPVDFMICFVNHKIAIYPVDPPFEELKFG